MLTALVLVVVVTGAEFLTRRYLIFLLPPLGIYRNNDFIALALIYLLIVIIMTNTRGGRLGRLTIGDFKAFLARLFSDKKFASMFTILFVGFSLSIAVGTALDSLIFGKLTPVAFNPIPVHVRAENPTSIAIVAMAVLAIVVNGFWVPLAEEMVWRGAIYGNLKPSLGIWLSVIVAAVFFSLKHAAVDLSLARVLMVLLFGFWLAAIREYAGLAGAALAHITANTTATALALILGRLPNR
jgi:membrane protease YdiL (CAAX protease family)